MFVSEDPQFRQCLSVTIYNNSEIFYSRNHSLHFKAKKATEAPCDNFLCIGAELQGFWSITDHRC